MFEFPIDLSVGSVFKYHNVKLQVDFNPEPFDPSCKDCYLFNEPEGVCDVFACEPIERKDKCFILFIEVK